MNAGRIGVLLAACLVLPALVRADLAKDLDAIATELAKPKTLAGKTIVVLNLLRADGAETHNSVDLATKLTGSLVRVAAKKCRIINRAAAERLYFEEKQYTTHLRSSAELKNLLEQFQADVAITGEYALAGGKLVLENLQTQAVPDTNRPPVVYSAVNSRKVKLAPEDSACCCDREALLPQPPDTISQAFLKLQTDSLYALAELTDKDGKRLTDNCARIGSQYRLGVDVLRDAFLYVFNYDEDHGRAYLLYPFAQQLEARRSGRLWLPDGDYTFDAIGPAGQNSILIFATRKPLKFTVPTTENIEFTAESIADFVRQLRALPRSDWSRYMLFANVVR